MYSQKSHNCTWDVGITLAMADFDDELRIELLGIWGEQSTVFIRDLRIHAENNTQESILRLLHRLKGSLHIIGAGHSLQLVQSIEQALGQCPRLSQQDQINELANQLQILQSEISQWLLAPPA